MIKVGADPGLEWKILEYLEHEFSKKRYLGEESGAKNGKALRL